MSRATVWIATVIGLALVSVPAAAEAPKTARIGYLAINALYAPEQQAAVDAFRLASRTPTARTARALGVTIPAQLCCGRTR